MSVGENVRWRRTALGLSQTELARRIRVHRKAPNRSYVCRLEQGKVDVPISVIRSLAKALKCQPWQLVAEVYENSRWWDAYLGLTAQQKRDIQHQVRWYADRR